MKITTEQAEIILECIEVCVQQCCANEKDLEFKRQIRKENITEINKEQALMILEYIEFCVQESYKDEEDLEFAKEIIGEFPEFKDKFPDLLKEN